MGISCHIMPTATVYKTKGFAQRDFSEAPKFTQPLADCTTITGYDTQLFCCVRASPRVSGELGGGVKGGYWAVSCSHPNLVTPQSILISHLLSLPSFASLIAGYLGTFRAFVLPDGLMQMMFPFSFRFLIYKDVTSWSAAIGHELGVVYLIGVMESSLVCPHLLTHTSSVQGQTHASCLDLDFWL